MSEQRLIDANALLEELEESIGKMVDWAAREPVCSPVYNMLRNKLDEREHFRNMIINAPTVEDVVQIVRCKDCEQWRRNIGITDSPNGHCFYHDIEMNGCDFCSYGERKGEEEW